MSSIELAMLFPRKWLQSCAAKEECNVLKQSNILESHAGNPFISSVRSQPGHTVRLVTCFLSWFGSLTLRVFDPPLSESPNFNI